MPTRHTLRMSHAQWNQLAMGALQMLGGRLGDSLPTIDLRQAIVDEAQSQGVPPAIALAVAWQESHIQQFKPNGDLVLGPSTRFGRAIGIFQLLQSTADGMGLDPTDPMQNIQGGVRYLAQMFSQFGTWQLALAAYNWGPGNLRNYLDNGKAPGVYQSVMQNYALPILAASGVGAIAATYASSPDTNLPADASTADNTASTSTGSTFALMAGVAGTLLLVDWLME